ncbi:enoyl-CoA hydratase/isomerase family protein [Sphingobium phenoxybenzoativorans]|uniref:enoyl-CoA hydratase/isomerase family protein n=1 Tax=Sphingobium phenoxybenzoativorans TaxID=1592790 RepID=UPI0008732774|nr:enoyl-CoA hydratase-related protein [Sphingobium phenoxybenzoativorans]
MTTTLTARETKGPLTIVSLTDPDRANALSMDMKQELLDHVADFFADPAQRCLVLTGTGRVFCAGGDLGTLREGQDAPATRARLVSTYALIRQLLLGEKPVIMAVNGAAAGGGFGLAMLGDVILASDKAKFRPAFPAVGVAADVGLALTLPRAIGSVRARDILLCDRTVEASEALAIGMVSAVHTADTLMAAAIELGLKLAAGPTQALGLTKKLLRIAQEVPLDTFLDAEFAAQAICFGSADCREGVNAFYEKRAPTFSGR